MAEGVHSDLVLVMQKWDLARAEVSEHARTSFEWAPLCKQCTFKCFDGGLGRVQLPLKTSYYISLHSWPRSCKVLTFKALSSLLA